MVNEVFSGNQLCEGRACIYLAFWRLNVSVQYLATNMLLQDKDIKKLSTKEPRSVQLSDRDCGL